MCSMVFYKRGLPALSNTVGLVFGANGTIVLCYKHSNELYIMDMIFHIYFWFTVVCFKMFNVGKDPPH